MCEGEWYFIETRYIQKLSNFLDPYFVDYHDFLKVCDSKNEADYNISVTNANKNVSCLDKKNIAPEGQRQVEPCDLISVIDDKVNLIHVKISTRSASLSHLFNQGVNSVELLRRESESKEKLKSLVNYDNTLCDLINNGTFSVTYGIITKKDKKNRSKNIPLFSRISLLRTLNALKTMNIPCSVYFIYDNINRKENASIDSE